MIDMALALALLVGSSAAQDDVDAAPDKIFAKDATRASRLEVDDPATLICVRSKILGSRIRFSQRCLTSDQWKAHEDEKRYLKEDIRNVKGINDYNYDPNNR